MVGSLPEVMDFGHFLGLGPVYGLSSLFGFGLLEWETRGLNFLGKQFLFLHGGSKWSSPEVQTSSCMIKVPGFGIPYFLISGL